MSFRRSTDNGPESPSWRRAHRSMLVECGIPAEVANSDRGWIYVLLHGEDAFGTGWNVSWMTPSQAKRLLEQLQPHIPNDSAYQLILYLRKRLQEPNGSSPTHMRIRESS